MSDLIGDTMEREDVREDSHVQCETMCENRYHTVVVGWEMPVLRVTRSHADKRGASSYQTLQLRPGVQCTLPAATATSPA